MTKLPDGSAFFVADIDTSKRPPKNPVFWNPGNKVVQNHETGVVHRRRTNIERAKRGLPVPWKRSFAATETLQPDIP